MDGCLRLAFDTELVVRSDGPLGEPQRGPVGREIDDDRQPFVVGTFVEQRSERSGRSRHPGELLGQPYAEGDGRTVRLAREVQEPADGERDDLRSLLRGFRADEALPLKRTTARGPWRASRSSPTASRLPWAEAFAHDGAPFEQANSQGPAIRMGKIARRAARRSGRDRPRQRFVVDERPPPAKVIALRRWLDSDDVGALLREDCAEHRQRGSPPSNTTRTPSSKAPGASSITRGRGVRSPRHARHRRHTPCLRA